MNNPSGAFNEVYKFQERVLGACRMFDTGFYLTGGIAAARGYLNHRYHTDLDLRVNDSIRFGLWIEQIIQRLRREALWQVQVLTQEERFCSLSVGQGELRIRVDFLNDGPLHFGAFSNHPALGLVDSPENIVANKIIALLVRPEPNDLADVWGLCSQKGVSLDAVLTNPASKAAGIFLPDLARLLCTATRDDWKLVNWVHPPQIDAYLAQLNQLGENLLLANPMGAHPIGATPIGAHPLSAQKPASAAASPQPRPPVTPANDLPQRQLRGPGLLNYAAAIKAAAQSSVASTPPAAPAEPPPTPAPAPYQPNPSKFIPAAPAPTPPPAPPPAPEDGDLAITGETSKQGAELRVRSRRKISYYLPVYLASSAIVLGHLADISEAGFRIDCKNSIMIGQELRLRLELPADMGRKPALIFTAFCRWCQPDYIEPVLFNAGFEVGKLSPDDVQTYKQVIEKYSAQARIW